MLSNVADVAMTTLESDTTGECNRTGQTCYLLLNVTTANTLKSEDSGAYLEIRLPGELRVYGSKCWARV